MIIKNKLTILLASDENYFVPLIMTIESALKNSSKEFFYEFKVLVPKIFNDNYCNILENIESDNKNCSIQLIEMSASYKEVKSTISHISGATFYRLWAASILNDVHKCIYLDVDIGVFGDLSELDKIDIGDNYIAGVKATSFHLHNDGYKSHLVVLGIPTINQYVNAGVLIMNLDKIRQDRMEAVFEKLIDKNFPVQDQDILNVACFGNIMLLPPKYNFMVMPELSKNDYIKVFGKKETETAYTAPVIVHYAGSVKPWKSPELMFAYEWWNICFYSKYSRLAWEFYQKCTKTENEKRICSPEYRAGRTILFIPSKIMRFLNACKRFGMKGIWYKIKEKTNFKFNHK